MREYAIDFQNYLTTYDSLTGEYKEQVITDSQRLELITDLLKYPGECNLDERVQVARKFAKEFEETGSYNQFYPNTLEDRRFWDFAKRLCYTGLLIDNLFYIPGDAIWYWNFTPIPDKVKKRTAFATIYDTDIWWYQLLELSRLSNKFTLTLKKRQMGFSLKSVSKILKRAWFEEGFSGKISAWDDTYNRTNWSIMEQYRTHLNKHTRWTRQFDGVGAKNSYGFWKEEVLGSIIKEANTKTNPAAVVSGKTDEILFDEAGVAPNLDETIGFVEPALKQGNIITGEMNVFGAVGKLDKSGPLKEYFYKPEAGNFLALPNRWSERYNETVGIFVPEYYSYGTFIDEFGNSKIEEAKDYLIEEGKQILEEKGFAKYALYRSQHPLTPEDCFSIRTKNIFPTEVIAPHYNWLLTNHKPFLVTLERTNSHIGFIPGAKTDIVREYPVKPSTVKHGAVVIDEPPISSNPPFGLYYAATDPVKTVSTDASLSLMSTYIFKAAHEIDGEFAQDKLVAWFTGRADSPYDTYQTSLDLVSLYNARWAVENDQPVFIEWLIGKNETHRLMRRSDMPLLKEWVPTSQIREELGWRTGSGNSTVKDKLFEMVIMYCTEEIGVEFDTKTGEPTTIYGVSRIMDQMLLKEMLEYDGKNADRIIAFGGVLMAARTNTNRGIKVRSNVDQKDLIKKALERPSFSTNSLSRPSFNSLRRTTR